MTHYMRNVSKPLANEDCFNIEPAERCVTSVNEFFALYESRMRRFYGKTKISDTETY